MSNIKTSFFTVLLLIASLQSIAQRSSVDYYNLAVKQTDSGNYLQAIKNYSKAIELNHVFHEAYFSLGYTYKLVGNYNLAIKNYSEAIRIQPNALYYYNRGKAYSNIYDYKLAISDCDSVLKLQPENIETLLLRALLFDQVNQDLDAINDYKKVLRFGYCKPKLYYDIGRIYESINQLDSAIVYYNLDILKDTTESYSYIRIAEIYEASSNFNKALSVYNQCILAFPSYGYAYYKRGFIKIHYFSDKKGGCEDLSEGYRLGFEASKTEIEMHCE
jgi:tetratricopeptide (TPR) repeat protein